MQTAEAQDLRYPVGRYRPPEAITEQHRREWIETLANAPAKYRAAVEGLSDEQLDTPYRPGGWTIRQVIHHVPDSHMNSYMRFRLALTEDQPAIRAYHEDLWAELPDAKSSPIAPSLELLDALHRRWVALLRAMTAEQYRKEFRHSEIGLISLEWTLGLYNWHCHHHLAHIENLKARMGW